MNGSDSNWRPRRVLVGYDGGAGGRDAVASAPTTVAVAYDGGAESRHALAYAGAIVAEAGAALEVLTVERPVDTVGGAIAYTMFLPEDVDEIQRRALREIDPKVKWRCRVLNGETADALADACVRGVDLLVVGSRGHGTIERVLLGSTSSALIEKAPCPVLVVPRPAELGSRPARAGDVESPDGQSRRTRCSRREHSFVADPDRSRDQVESGSVSPPVGGHSGTVGDRRGRCPGALRRAPLAELAARGRLDDAVGHRTARSSLARLLSVDREIGGFTLRRLLRL